MKGHIAHKGKRWYPVTDGKDEAGKRKRVWHRGFSTKREAQKYLNEPAT